MKPIPGWGLPPHTACLLYTSFEFCVNTIQSLIDLFTDLSDTLFQSAYVQGLLSFFQYFGYCLFIIACIIGIFEMVIQYQNGDGSAARSLFMNFIKGLMAALLFTTLPVLLFQFVLELQKYITVALTEMCIRDRRWEY